MRGAQNWRQHLDQVWKKNQECQRTEGRERLRECESQVSDFVAAIPALENSAAENNPGEKRGEHQRKGIG